MMIYRVDIILYLESPLRFLRFLNSCCEEHKIELFNCLRAALCEQM